MATNELDEPRLGDEVEELLADWPVLDKAPSDWEALAAAIDARLRLAEPGDTSDLLLQAPLPEAEDEAENAGRRSHPRMKRPSQGSLTRLARASLGEPAPAFERDELARALLSQAVKARTESRALSTLRRPPTQESADKSEPSAGGKPLPIDAGRGAAGDPAGAVAEVRGARAMWFGIAFGVAGMAAAGFMYISGPGNLARMELSAPVNNTELAEPARLAAHEALATPDTSEGAARTKERALNVEEISMDVSAHKAPGRPNLARLNRPATSPLAVPKPTDPGRTEPSTIDQARPAPGPSEAGMTMADSRHTSLPDKPSTGAVQVAIGSVMGTARACVAGQTANSQAVVRFGSDGRVKNVGVSGPAAGTSAEACVRAALSAARVQPFSQATFAVNLSIRPR